MKIIELRSENIKNIKVIEIRPDGAVVLEGKNGAGKSAVIDSIFMALTGKKIEQPIRNGESRAEINIDLGDFKVKKIFTAKGERLEVTSTEGASFKTPQTMLNKIMGNLAFDPLKFAELGKTTAGQREQRNILANLVGLNFEKLDKDREGLYNERTIKHRMIKGADSEAHHPDPLAPLPLEARVAKMEIPAAGTPRQEISMAEELAKLDKMELTRREYIEDCRHCEEYNKKAIEAKDQRITDITEEINDRNTVMNDLANDIEELKRQINSKVATLDELSQENNRAKNELNKLKALVVEKKSPPAETVTELEIIEAKNALKEIEAKNTAIRAAIEFDKTKGELESARKSIRELEKKMMDIDLEKQDRVNKAVFPIAGLGITDQFVTYNNKPFSQLSTGEQIRVSTAVAMALNPTLKVILIREGSLLDTEGRKAVFSMAEEKDYQVWMETVADARNCGIYLENGEIKNEFEEKESIE